MSFEDVMMERLSRCGTEACREIEKSQRAGRSLGDAVLDAIESLPKSKTRDLRRWVSDWETYDEWLAFKKGGWKLEKIGSFLYLLAPPDFEPQGMSGAGAANGPSLDVVAVAAEAIGLHVRHGRWIAEFQDSTNYPSGEWQIKPRGLDYGARYKLFRVTG